MLGTFLLILVSIGPGLLWLWYFYNLDRYEPEPLRLIFKVFFTGLLLVLPAGFIEQIWRNQLLRGEMNSIGDLLIFTFLVVALVEEGLKTGFLWLQIGKSRELNEPVDGIIYGITMGLGFASLENLLWTRIYGYQVALMRAVITTLAHVAFSGWAGYYLSRYKLESGGERPVLLWIGFLFALTAHGLYDFLLFLENTLATGLALVVIAFLMWRLYVSIRSEVARSPFR